MDIDERLEESIDNKYIQDDKGKNEMKLTVEESYYILKRKDFNSYVEEKAIETLLNELDKKDKIINEMAEVLNDFDYDKQCEICHTDICSASVDGTEYMKCIIDYFTKKVEGK